MLPLQFGLGQQPYQGSISSVPCCFYNLGYRYLGGGGGELQNGTCVQTLNEVLRARSLSSQDAVLDKTFSSLNIHWILGNKILELRTARIVFWQWLFTFNCMPDLRGNEKPLRLTSFRSPNSGGPISGSVHSNGWWHVSKLVILRGGFPRCVFH